LRIGFIAHFGNPPLKPSHATAGPAAGFARTHARARSSTTRTDHPRKTRTNPNSSEEEDTEREWPKILTRRDGRRRRVSLAAMEAGGFRLIEGGAGVYSSYDWNQRVALVS
jgi:hypothetical protein